VESRKCEASEPENSVGAKPENVGPRKPQAGNLEPRNREGGNLEPRTLEPGNLEAGNLEPRKLEAENLELRNLEPRNLEPRNPGTPEPRSLDPPNPGAPEPGNLLSGARAIAGDHDSGASELVARVLPVLADAIAVGRGTTMEIARIVCGGQPIMAPLWRACAAAVAEHDRPGTFALARADLERSPRALVRAAAAALRDLLLDDPEPLLITLSYSGSVCSTLETIAAERRLRVVCGEGRPRYEGRRLATALERAGAQVTLVVDAALTSFLAEASAVLVGADAVFGDAWVNKIGTFGLAAAASFCGTPVYVVAARDKFVPASVAARLVLPLRALDEVWPEGSAQISRVNRYFESTPAHLATLFLSSAGPLSPDDLASAVEAHPFAVPLDF
jgi:Initiation factor 2 subunit family